MTDLISKYLVGGEYPDWPRDAIVLIETQDERIAELEKALDTIADIWERSDIIATTTGERASQAYDMRCVARTALEKKEVAP